MWSRSVASSDLARSTRSTWPALDGRERGQERGEQRGHERQQRDEQGDEGDGEGARHGRRRWGRVRTPGGARGDSPGSHGGRGTSGGGGPVVTRPLCPSPCPLRLLFALLVLAGCERPTPRPPTRPGALGRLALTGGRAPRAPTRGAARTAADAGGLDLVLPTANRACSTAPPTGSTKGSTRPSTACARRSGRAASTGSSATPSRRSSAGGPSAASTRASTSPRSSATRPASPVDVGRRHRRGRVAYANHGAGASSYGKYVVVEHDWSDSPVYSLYAHLSDVAVAEGETVAQGDRLGTMGYTGRGLGPRPGPRPPRDRLHGQPARAAVVRGVLRRLDLHGRFFGTNLAGVPPADLYLALADEPRPDVPRVRRVARRGLRRRPAGRPAARPDRALPLARPRGGRGRPRRRCRRGASRSPRRASRSGSRSATSPSTVRRSRASALRHLAHRREHEPHAPAAGPVLRADRRG